MIQNTTRLFNWKDRDFRRQFVISCGLVALVLVVYWPVRSFDFVNLDDNGYVYNNKRVREGMSIDNVGWALTTSYFWNWHPLVWISYLSDSTVYDMAPSGFHVTNLAFHSVNCILVFIALGRITGTIWPSALAAAIFAIHPLNVETVSWVACRKDVLYLFFGLLCVLAYHQFVVREDVVGRSKAYAFSLTAFGLSLMSKQMLVTLPFLLLLLDYWPLRRWNFSDNEDESGSDNARAKLSSRQLVVEKLPFFAMTIIFSITAYVAQASSGGVQSLEKVPLLTRIGNSVVVYAQVLRRFFWPQDLAAFYPHPRESLSTGAITVSVIILLAASLMAIRYWRRHPYLIVGWLWFLGTFVPVIGLIQLGNQQTANRYVYLPILGLTIAAIWTAASAATRLRVQAKPLGVICGLLLAVLSLSSRIQASFWKNSETLFRRALEVTENNGVAHLSLGGALQDNGQVDDAIEQFKLAIELDDENALAHNKLGFAFQLKEEFDKAFTHFRRAVELKPKNAFYLNNLGNEFRRQGKIDEAIAHYRRSLATSPEYVHALLNLADTLYELGQNANAGALYKRAYEQSPNDPTVKNRLAGYYWKIGRDNDTESRAAEAMAFYRRAIKVDPTHVDSHYDLGRILLLTGKLQEAADELTATVKLNPKFAEAHNDLGATLMKQRDFYAAANHFRIALELKPDFKLAKQNLQMAIQQLPNPESVKP